MSISLTPEQPENVVAINADAEKELEITRKIRERQFACSGQHRRVEVDSERRLLKCRDCGYLVDPFDYIEAWAISGERRMTGLKGVAHRELIAGAEYLDLMRKVKNLRAQLKRTGHPQPRVERDEFDRQRLNAEWLRPEEVVGGGGAEHGDEHATQTGGPRSPSDEALRHAEKK